MGIDSEYFHNIIDLLDCYSRMLVKDWGTQDSKAVQRDLAMSMAKLEITLPCYWNTQARHMPLCRFIWQLNEYGSFWAECMLAIESYHQHVGNCGRSKKNMMKSFANNYEVFDVKQTMWSADDEDEGKNDSAAAGSRYFKEPPGSMDSLTVSLGKRQALRSVDLSQLDYLKVVRLYHEGLDQEDGHPHLKCLLTKYLLEVDVESSRFYYVHEWKPKSTLSRAAMDLLKTIRATATTQVYSSLKFCTPFRPSFCTLFRLLFCTRFRPSFILYPFSSFSLYPVSFLFLYTVFRSIVLCFVTHRKSTEPGLGIVSLRPGITRTSLSATTPASQCSTTKKTQKMLNLR